MPSVSLASLQVNSVLVVLFVGVLCHQVNIELVSQW